MGHHAFLDLRAKGGLGPMKYSTPSERTPPLRLMIGRPDDWTRGTAGKLAAASQSVRSRASAVRSSHWGTSPPKAPAGIQDGGAEIRGAAGRGSLQELLDAVQAEFLGGMFVVTLAGNHSAGNQQQRGIFLKGHGGSIASGVGEESQREASRTEFDDAGMVAEQSWCVSGVGVADGAELLVVAGDESGTGVDAFAGVDKAAIDAKTELRHGIRSSLRSAGENSSAPTLRKICCAVARTERLSGRSPATSSRPNRMRSGPTRRES